MMASKEKSLTDLIHEYGSANVRSLNILARHLIAEISQKDPSEVTQSELCAKYREIRFVLTEAEKVDANVRPIRTKILDRIILAEGEIEDLKESKAAQESKSREQVGELQAKIDVLEAQYKYKLVQIGELGASILELGTEIEKRNVEHEDSIYKKNKAVQEAAEREARLQSDLKKTKLAASQETRQLDNDVEIKIKEITGLKDQLASECAGKSCLEESINKLEDYKTWAGEHIEALESQVNTLQDALDKYCSEVGDKQEEIFDLKSKVRNLEADNIGSEGQIEFLTTHLAGLQSRMACKLNTIRDLQDQVSDLTAQKSAQEEEAKTLKAQVKAASNDIQDMAKDIEKRSAGLQSDVDTLVAQNDTAQATVDTLSELAYTRGAKIEKLESDLEFKDRTISALEVQVNNFTGRNKSSDDKIKALETKVTELQDNLALRDEIIDEKTSQIEATDDMLMHVEDRLKDMSCEHQVDLAAKDEEIASVKTEMAHKLNAKDRGIAVKDSEAADLREEIASCHNFLALRNSTISEMAREKKDLHDDIDQLQSDMKSKDSAITDLRSPMQEQTLFLEAQSEQVSALSKEVGKAAGVSQSQSREIARLNGKVCEKNGEIEVLEKRVAELDHAYNDNDKTWFEQCESLKWDVCDQNEEMERLNQHIRGLRDQVSCYHELIEEKDGELIWLRKQLVKQTGIEVGDGVEISFIDAHFGHEAAAWAPTEAEVKAAAAPAARDRRLLGHKRDVSEQNKDPGEAHTFAPLEQGSTITVTDNGSGTGDESPLIVYGSVHGEKKSGEKAAEAEATAPLDVTASEDRETTKGSPDPKGVDAISHIKDETAAEVGDAEIEEWEVVSARSVEVSSSSVLPLPA